MCQLGLFDRQEATPVQALFKKHGLAQVDLYRALRQLMPTISRTYAHYVWHGTRSPTLDVLLAIRQAFPEIPEHELVETVAQARRLQCTVQEDQSIL
jgi:hypothetical protein